MYVKSLGALEEGATLHQSRRVVLKGYANRRSGQELLGFTLIYPSSLQVREIQKSIESTLNVLAKFQENPLFLQLSGFHLAFDKLANLHFFLFFSKTGQTVEEFVRLIEVEKFVP